MTDTRAPPDVDSLLEVAGRARDLKLSLGDGLSTLPIRLAQTKTLAIDAYVEEDSSTAFWDALLRDASIPHLEALEIFVRTYDDGIEALRRTPAFLDVSFPRLQRLTLYNVVDMAALARSPLLRSVRQLRFNYHQLNDFSELTPHLVAHRPLFGDRRVELDGPHSDNAEPLLDAGYVILDA